MDSKVKLVPCTMTEMSDGFVSVSLDIKNKNYTMVRLYEYLFAGRHVIIKDDMQEVEKDRYKINFEVFRETDVEGIYAKFGQFNTHWERTDRHLGECAIDTIWSEIDKRKSKMNQNKIISVNKDDIIVTVTVSKT